MSNIKLSFKINLNVLTVLGLYCPNKITTFFKVRAYVTYILCTLVVTCLGILYLILAEDLTPTQISNDAFLMAQMTSQVTKLLPFVTNAAAVKRCIYCFDKPEFRLQKDNHKNTFDNYVKTCRRNSMIFIFLVLGGNIFWATKPFFSTDQTLPVDIWLPSKLTSQPETNFLIYIFLVIAVAFTSISCAAIDTIIGGLACLATGQITILKNKLEHINEYVEERINNQKQTQSRVKIFHTIIKECIHHHNSILKFISDYEECFSLAVFGQFMGSIIVIGFSCLQISKLDPLTYNFLTMVTCLSFFLVEIYVYCYYGTTLFEESNSLTNAIYMGQWYEFDLKSKKYLIILMERSKKPIIITAGKILDMSLETFTTILKRSYSLLAVIKNQ